MIKPNSYNPKEPLHQFWNKGGFSLCIDGEAEISINEQNYHLSRGSVFVVTPLVQIYALYPSKNFDTISFINDLNVFYPIFQLISNTGIPLKIREKPCWQLTEEEINYVTAQKTRIEQKQILANNTISTDERKLLQHHINLLRHETMLELVGNQIRLSPTTLDSIAKQEIMAYRFILTLHDNYRFERSVSWYASQANLSPGHFTTIIKTATGKTPSEWIANVTITFAKLMLEQSSKSIKEIAQELNFPEQFTFRKYFKQHTGLPPKEYRKLYCI